MKTMKTMKVLLLSLPLLQCTVVADTTVPPAPLNEFWRASTPVQQQLAAELLLAMTTDVDTLYGWLRKGPQFSAAVPRGYQELSRSGPDGLRFPYVVLIPDSYDPARPYPVEFMLHGGVGRPLPEEGGGWWRRGYDELRREDRITVVPAAWDEAFWWFPNQADNVPAILREIKRLYNVDDNRVTLTGVSDGGTGAYFFAFMQPTEWAAFLPYIGHPGVLRNPRGRASYHLFFENLGGKPLYIVNGEEDPLYPASAVRPYIELFQQANVEHVFRVIHDGGHDTRWLPEETPAIESFKQAHPRDPLPDTVQWVTNRTDLFNRNHWLRIDELAEEGQPGRVIASRDGNRIAVTSYYTLAFTLLLSPEEIDFDQPVEVEVNGVLAYQGTVDQSARTLLQWAARDLDRSMLFSAELQFQLPREPAQ
jgi:predicted esterase